MEGRHVDDVVEGTAAGLQGRFQIGEGQADLGLEVRLGRAVAAAWPEAKQPTARTLEGYDNRARIGRRLVMAGL